MGVLDAAQEAQDDAADTSQDVSDDNQSKATAGALSTVVNPTTTEEARGYARKFLNKELSEGDQSDAEEPILSGMEKNAQAARAALQKARQSLLDQQATAQQNDVRDKYLSMAQSFGAPTKSGSFFENLSNYAGNERKRQDANLQQQQQFAQQGLNLDTQEAGVDDSVQNARLQLQKLHEQTMSGMGKEALNILGRPSLQPPKPTKPTGPASTFGKQALDEGYPFGSPAYQARVQELTQADLDAKRARAGIDVTTQDPTKHAAFASSVGVPADVPNPWEGMSTKERMAGEAIEQRKATADFDKYPAVDQQIQASQHAIDQFQALNAQTHTGPELAPVTVGGVHAGLHGVGADSGGEGGWNWNPMSVIAGFKPNIQTMNKIAANLSVLAKPEGFGARTTNFDLQTFKSGMIGTDKSQATNDVIAQALKARLQNEQDWHEFEQNYYQVYGHRRGAEPAFNDYLKNNPIFDPTAEQGKAGLYKLNPNRVDYKTYFADHNAKAFAAAASPVSAPGAPSQYADVTDKDRNDPTFSGMSDEAIHNAKIPAQARGGSISFADGGEVDSGEQPAYKDMLNSLREGASFKLSNAPEDPESPGGNLLGEAVGAGGVTAAAIALSRLGKKLGLGSLAKLVTEHPSIAATLIGGTAGTVAGGASSRDSDPTYDAISGGLMGAAAGPLARYGIKAGVEGLGGLADRATGNVINAGDKKLIPAMQADNPAGGLDAIATRLRNDARARVPSTIGDASGPRTAGVVATALGKDTPETAAYADQLNTRQEGANSRVQEQVNQGLAPDPYLQKQQDLVDALRTNAAPLYQQAYAAYPAVRSQALMDIMNTPSGSEAAARAFKSMQDQQLPIGKPDVTGMVSSPSLQYLDQVKRSLDDMITQEEGSGPNYSATNQGRILRGMRNKLVSEVDAATAGPGGQPGPYQMARQQYAGDLEVQDALRSGNEDFNRMTPAELQQRVGQMSYAERDAFRSGVAENLFQRLGNTTGPVNPANRILGTPALQDKLGAIFEKPSDANKFMQGVQRESETFDTSKPLIRAADTGQAQSFKPASLAQLARTSIMPKSTASDIANTASQTAGPDAQAAIVRLRASADRLRTRADLGNAAGVAGAAGLATGMTPSNTQPQQASQ
jgi:hypothetical protein